MRRSEELETRVYSVSAAPPSAKADRDHRMRSYLISMTIRTVSFALVGVFVTILPWPPGAWICAIAAVVLPYPAVVFANATNKRTQDIEFEAVTPQMLMPPPPPPSTD
ncbi:DUF3099 domain-containing protein [Gephyromycinifex aptenodytis]|uniref:DUF3099 domain-containing protein n=1 Tax=Gephyromycinifex aptenodytis TaxID=2716227 RepID=UPI001447DB6D|nr:DUF3099 domain-containing protein [Gephyromycinifex aptenodytis]